MANVHKYDDPLIVSEERLKGLTTKKGVPTTWGEAVDLRIGKQNAPFRRNYPMGNYEMQHIK